MCLVASVVVRASLLALAVALVLGCKESETRRQRVHVPERCDQYNSDRALSAWFYYKALGDGPGLDQAANCLVVACSSGVRACCEDVALLCGDPENRPQESLMNRNACSLPGVVIAMPPAVAPADAGTQSH